MDKLITQNRVKIDTLFIAIFSILISFLFFGKTLNSQMGIIDDHTYFARSVLTDTSAVWKNFINAPEIKSFGNSPRFRIIYDLINNTETLVFRTNASYWYLTNIFVFAFFIFTVFYLTYKNLNIKWAIPFTLYVISSSYFALIFTRLGTAEVWTILGCSIYALGFNSLYHKSKSSKTYSEWKEWLAMILGAIIAIGSKENFAVMGVLFITIFIILKLRHKISFLTILSTIFLLFINCFQILDIYLTQKNNGVDYYQNNSETIYRITKVVSGLFLQETRPYTTSLIIFIFILILFYFLVIKTNKKNLQFKLLISYFITPLVTTLVLAAILIFNLYIYNGTLNTTNRYAFPSVLITQIQLLVISRWFYNILSRKNKLYTSILFFSIFLISIPVLLFKDYSNLKYSRDMSTKNVEATNLFQNKLTEIVKLTKKNPDYPIVFSSYQPFDYEPMVSIKIYLRYSNIYNTLMVKTNYNKEITTDNPLSKWVMDENFKFEKSGGNGFTSYGLKKDEKCFLIDFNGTTTDTQCENLGKIWQLGSYPY